MHSQSRQAPILLLLCSLLAALLAGPGCEASRFGRARRRDTVPAYLRYLDEYPEGRYRQEALKRAEELRFRQARRSGRPLGCRMYLERHPRGRFVAACRQELARLALMRARSVAGLVLVLEHYDGTAQARQARSRLPALLARQALGSNDPQLAASFLDRYPGHALADKVRAHLARLRYKDLPPRRQDLEAFAHELAGTSEAKRAMARVRKMLAREVREIRDPNSLEEYRSRFPQGPELAELQTLVRHHQTLRATARGDLEALRGLGLPPDSVEGRQVERILAWCKAHERACRRTRELIRQAHPWVPVKGDVAALRAGAFDVELQEAWRAMATMGWLLDPQAATILLELAGSARLSTVWASTKALSRWLSRQSTASRAAWQQRQLAAPLRRANSDELQRRGLLLLLAGQRRQGQQLLAELIRREGRALSGGYLLLWEKSRDGGSPASVDAGHALHFVSAARARVQWLKDAFPSELNRDSVQAATLAERELFALGQAMEEVRQASSAPALADLSRSIEAMLAEWRGHLTKTDSTFRSAQKIDLSSEVSRHGAGRARALAALLKDRSPLSKGAARAICALAPIPSCPAR